MPVEARAAEKKKRAYFVDILRLIASFQMVNGHTLDAVLATEFRSGPYWGDYLWFRGMVSVAFMFVAGFAFHLATLARFEKHRSRPHEIRKRFRRGVDLIIIGYLLRFPFDYLHRLGDIPDELVDVLLRCNVLQCIGITLIVLEALTVWCRTPRQVVLFAGLLATGATLVAPLTDPLVPQGTWQVLLSYVSHQSGSLFPVIPWSTFMLSGAVIGYLSMPDGAATSWRVTLVRVVGIVSLLYVLMKVLVATQGLYDFTGVHVNSRPAFIFERLTAITFAIGVLCLVSIPLNRFPKFLQILSGETLFLYVFHLVVIFSLPFGVSAMIGKTLNPGLSLGVSAFMVCLTAGSGLAWHRFQSGRKARRREKAA